MLDGAHAIGDAGRLIALGDANVMLAGGAESAVNRLSIAGFCACRALSTGFNDRPTQASRPYDRDRDGFVMGDGAGCVVLEEFEHAKARGAHIYAELIGYGLSGDAFHITAPAPDGDGAFRSMSMALKRAGLTASEIDYVNAHGTSTPVGDEIELKAVERLLGNSAAKTTMSSTKSSIGHLLGARGRSRRSSPFWRSAIRSLRRRSIWTIPRSRRRSTLRRTPRASDPSERRSPTRSVSAAPTPRWRSPRRPERPSHFVVSSKVAVI